MIPQMEAQVGDKHRWAMFMTPTTIGFRHGSHIAGVEQ